MEIPNLHDGSLVGLELSESDVIARLTDWKGKSYLVSMRGVRRFEVKVGHLNLIGWLEIIQERRPNRRLLDWLYGRPTRRWGEEAYRDARADQDDVAEEVRSGKASLVVLHGNFRIFFAALCESVTLQEG